MNKLDGFSKDIESPEVAKLKAVFNEVVSDGKIDIDKLLNLCGDYIEKESEKYSFTWKGKSACYQLAQARTDKTLIPQMDESVNWDTTQNLYIEGDNLDVLKLLQTPYSGSDGKGAKMIYIDPPYNTGNDFIYNDKFAKKMKDYIAENGEAMVSNPETAGAYHAEWLNMIFPRLRLAKNLLNDDGVIFISIDDHELANLRKVCDEVFGEDNFLADIIWNSTKSVTNTALISVSHTHTLVYFKNLDYYTKNREKFRLPDDGEGFENPDNDPRGAWKADPFQVGGWRPNQQYTITNPNTGVEYKPNEGCSWKNDFNKFQELVADNRIVFGKDGKAGPQRKRFIWEAEERGKVAKTLWDEVETTTNGTQLVKKLFDGVSMFDNPKPVGLIKKMLQLCTSDNDLIIDFFSGSATTAHAVMQLNAEDGGNRRFIMVQVNELTYTGKKDKFTDEDGNELERYVIDPATGNPVVVKDSEARKAGYYTIPQIGRERIRRAGAKIAKGDVGFRAFKLLPSNINSWDTTPILDKNVGQLKSRLIDALERYRKDRKPIDFVFEVCMKMGVNLSAEIKEVENKTYLCEDTFGDHLLVCLAQSVDMEYVRKLADNYGEYGTFVFGPDAFTEVDVMQNAEKILEDYGIQYELV